MRVLLPPTTAAQVCSELCMITLIAHSLMSYKVNGRVRFIFDGTVFVLWVTVLPVFADSVCAYNNLNQNVLPNIKLFPMSIF